MQSHNLSFLRAVACVVLIVALCMSLAACNLFDRSNNKQQTVPNSTPNTTPDNTPEIETPEETPEEEKTTDEEKQPDEQKTPDEQKQPEAQEQPSEDTTTEAEYKAKFEAELPSYIENYFNENLIRLSSQRISNIEVILYNHYDGTVYIHCEQSGFKRFIVLTNCNLKETNNYKEIYTLLPNITFITNNVKGQTRITEHGVPEDICAYALSQPKVHDFLTSRGITSSEIINYKVINTTEFQSTSNGSVTNITMLVGDKIVTLSIGGTTGNCKSQREYLSKLQNGRLRVVENIVVTEYSELALNSAY